MDDAAYLLQLRQQRSYIQTEILLLEQHDPPRKALLYYAVKLESVDLQSIQQGRIR